MMGSYEKTFNTVNKKGWDADVYKDVNNLAGNH